MFDEEKKIYVKPFTRNEICDLLHYPVCAKITDYYKSDKINKFETVQKYDPYVLIIPNNGYYQNLINLEHLIGNYYDLCTEKAKELLKLFNKYVDVKHVDNILCAHVRGFKYVGDYEEDIKNSESLSDSDIYVRLENDVYIVEDKIPEKLHITIRNLLNATNRELNNRNEIFKLRNKTEEEIHNLQKKMENDVANIEKRIEIEERDRKEEEEKLELFKN